MTASQQLHCSKTAMVWLLSGMFAAICNGALHHGTAAVCKSLRRRTRVARGAARRRFSCLPAANLSHLCIRRQRHRPFSNAFGHAWGCGWVLMVCHGAGRRLPGGGCAFGRWLASAAARRVTFCIVEDAFAGSSASGTAGIATADSALLTYCCRCAWALPPGCFFALHLALALLVISTSGRRFVTMATAACC